MQNNILVQSTQHESHEPNGLCRLRLRELSEIAQISEFAWDAWLAPLQFEIENSTALIFCPQEFHIEYLPGTYGSMIQKAITDKFSEVEHFDYRVKEGQTDTANASKDPTLSLTTPLDIHAKLEVPFTQHVQLPPQVAPSWRSGILQSYTFSNFIKGSGNSAASVAAQSVAQAPGWTQYNPLVIFGSTGLGKTHLMHAIGNASHYTGSAKKIFYRTAEQMLEECVQFMRQNKSTHFLRLYQDADILLVDDIQFLTRGANTQDLFCQLFLQLMALNKQVVICCDRPPHEISDDKGRRLHDRLLQSFQRGLVVDMSLPDSTTRYSILQQKLRDHPHFDCINSAVLEVLSQCHIQNIRELEGLLVKIFAIHDLQKRTITPELVRVLLSDSLRNTSKKLSLDTIISRVALHYNFSVEQITSSSRTHAIVLARKVAMHLCRALTDNSLHSVALKFNKDYTTVMFAIKTLMEAMKHDAELELNVLNLHETLKLSILD
jgi:chromosomal replication initiator protein